MDPKYLPNCVRNPTREDVLRYRIPGLDKPQHTIMAQYGNQHCLPDVLLQGKGLLGFFVRTIQGFRYWSPLEILMMHLQIAPAILLKPAKLSWFLLGNSICLPHVLLLQTNALRILFGTDRVPTMNEVFEDALKSRLKASQASMDEDKFAWYIAQSKWEVADAKAFLTFFLESLQWRGDSNSVFPQGTWFHPSKGLIHQHRVEINALTIEDIVISPTLPFRFTTDILLMAIPGEYGVITIMTMMTWMDVLQIWDYKFCPTDENGMMQNGQWINQASDETQQYLLFWNDDLRNQSQISNATPGKLVLYYDNDRLLIHKSNTDDIRTFRKDTHLQQFDYDSTGILTSMDIPNQITLLKKRDDNWKNLPFVVNPELLTKLDIEAMTPPKTDILLFKVTGDPTAIEMMIMLWNQLYDQQWLQEKGRVMNIQLLDSSNIRILFRPMLPITALPSLVLKDEMKMRAIRSYLTSTTTKEIAPSNLIFKYEGRSIGRGCYPDAFSFDALRNFVQHAFVTSSLGDPPSIVALGKRIGDGVVLKDSLDQRSQLLPQKERTNLGHLA